MKSSLFPSVVGIGTSVVSLADESGLNSTNSCSNFCLHSISSYSINLYKEFSVILDSSTNFIRNFFKSVSVSMYSGSIGRYSLEVDRVNKTGYSLV